MIEADSGEVGGLNAEHDPRATGLGEDLADEQVERLAAKTLCLKPVVDHEAINPLIAVIAIERGHGKADRNIATADQHRTAGRVLRGFGKGIRIGRDEMLLLRIGRKGDDGRVILERDRFEAHRKRCIH